MTKADLTLIDNAIQKYGDDWWNDPNDADGETPSPNREWIVEELLALLSHDGIDLKVIRKKIK